MRRSSVCRSRSSAADEVGQRVMVSLAGPPQSPPGRGGAVHCSPASAPSCMTGSRFQQLPVDLSYIANSLVSIICLVVMAPWVKARLGRAIRKYAQRSRQYPATGNETHSPMLTR